MINFIFKNLKKTNILPNKDSEDSIAGILFFNYNFFKFILL